MLKKVLIYTGIGAATLIAAAATYFYVFVPYEERQTKLNRIMIFRRRAQ